MNPTLFSILLFLVVAIVAKYILDGRRNAPHIDTKQKLPAGHFKIVGHEIEKWTPQDVVLLRAYFQTQNGQKFYKLCNNLCLSEAVRECAGDNAVPTAAGMDKLLRFQQNLCSEKMESDLIAAIEKNQTKTEEVEA